ncbi:MAG: aminoacetone oxidase family FAD-binding enzyme [Firmicutes bacterium]|nr:aminoacetone oxidase family FAD-binding enzyme [Bacillota bacterium]
MVYDCIIVGAGAAGLFCGAAFSQKQNGLILEKTRRTGTKLLMSGSGQCNITHDGSIKDFIPCYGKNGGRIRSCLYRYHNVHLREFLKKNGVDTFVRDDGKVFPKSMDAKEVRDMLCRKAAQNGFIIQHDSPVTALAKTDSGWCLSTTRSDYLAKTVILATGGCSYPTTGSDGSIFDVLKRDLEIEIIPPKPALSPVKVQDYPYTSLSGISFANGGVVLLDGDKKLAEHNGGLLLTHRDFSGPAVMNISKHGFTGGCIQLNYLYPVSYEDAFAILKASLEGNREPVEKLLAATFDLPRRFAKAVVQRAGNSPKELAKILTRDTFTITSIGSFNQAMATAGGIALSEVNTKTMELKKHPGLFAIGEVLDIDGMTGGYNLQFAYASACAASDAVCG